jgi:hypothetical protein
VVALSRLRRAGAVLLGALLVAGHLSARDPVLYTGSQINPALLELREWARELPADASVRLDTWPPRQLWGSYMLARQPLCSQLPLLRTAYPRVEVSRKADYILVDRDGREFYDGAPPDAAGPPLRTNTDFDLYRMKASVPGPENCSKRLVYDTR